MGYVRASFGIEHLRRGPEVLYGVFVRVLSCISVQLFNVDVDELKIRELPFQRTH